MTNRSDQVQQNKQQQDQSGDAMQETPIVSNLNPATNIPQTTSAKQPSQQDDADDAVQAILQSRNEGPNQC